MTRSWLVRMLSQVIDSNMISRYSETPVRCSKPYSDLFDATPNSPDGKLLTIRETPMQRFDVVPMTVS